MKKDILLIGGGGHCESCIDVIETEGKFKIAGIIDMKKNLHKKVLDYEIIACDDSYEELLKEYKYYLITIGQIKNAGIRAEKFEYFKKFGAEFPMIISPFAYVSKHVDIGEGTIVMHKAVINANAKIGRNCIINSASLIEHQASIGNHCHISTGSIVNGECCVENCVFIGSNSVIVNNLNIAENTIIGAGTVVIESINKSGTYVGNPARRIK